MEKLNVISDIRKKKDIELLNKDYCVNFIKNISPKKFVYIHEDTGLQFGYIAPDLIKNDFGDLIMVSENDQMEEYIDEDGFVSEKDKLYTLTRSQIIPILHNAIKNLYSQIEELRSLMIPSSPKQKEPSSQSNSRSSSAISEIDPYETITVKGEKNKIKKKI